MKIMKLMMTNKMMPITTKAKSRKLNQIITKYSLDSLTTIRSAILASTNGISASMFVLGLRT